MIMGSQQARKAANVDVTEKSQTRRGWRSFANVFGNIAAERTLAVIGVGITQRKCAFSGILFQTFKVGFHANVSCLAKILKIGLATAKLFRAVYSTHEFFYFSLVLSFHGQPSPVRVVDSKDDRIDRISATIVSHQVGPFDTPGWVGVRWFEYHNPGGI